MNDRLFEKLCDILSDMERKDKLSASDVQIIDWATHAKKSMRALEEMDGGYSGNSYRGSYRDGSYRDGGMSNRGRRRDSMGRYASDDGYSRNYSRHDGREEYLDQLRDMMEIAPDEKSRQNIQRMIREMEQA